MNYPEPNLILWSCCIASNVISQHQVTMCRPYQLTYKRSR